MSIHKGQTCCFVGHRKLPESEIEHILLRLDREVEKLIARGVTDFISGGVPGFDLLAAALIFAKKEIGRDVRLIFALACGNQDAFWSRRQRELYRNLLAEADEVIQVSALRAVGCMKRRERFMVDRSAYCIFARLYPLGGTDRMIEDALRMGLQVINVAK